jgi:NAD(P)-dependent dehydrogenase (short-subunit alcohol dehydrogenase family)
MLAGMNIASKDRTDGVLIVTGGSRGIGAAIVRLAALRGWKVLATYVDRQEEAEATTEQIAAAGGQVMAIRADSSKEDDVRRTFDTAEKHFGKVTGLVNNAGIADSAKMLVDISLTDIRRLFEINVFGYMLHAQEAARRMGTNFGGRGGAIVNMGSASARLGSANERIHYAASKGAVVSMTIGMAKELIPFGIRVNCISPGLMATEMNPPERLALLGPSIPFGRTGTVDDVANAVMFLLSPQSDYIIGVDLAVSGGR